MASNRHPPVPVCADSLEGAEHLAALGIDSQQIGCVGLRAGTVGDQIVERRGEFVVRRLRYGRERAWPRTLGWSMEAAMNPWIVVVVVLLVLFAWAWMFDRRRGRREDVFSAVRRARARDDAVGLL